MNPQILFVSSMYSLTEDAQLVERVARSLRIPFDIIYAGENESELLKRIQDNTFQLIIFEDFLLYFNLDSHTKSQLDVYCKRENISIIGFMSAVNTLQGLPKDPQFAEVSDYSSLVQAFVFFVW